MTKPLPTIWNADPHTLAKIEILKAYLSAWLPIIARTFTSPIVYVDGFAGPGVYKNGKPGSPKVASDTMLN